MVERYASDKDHENALLALAVYYARHGKGPLALKDIKTIGGDEMNLDLPNRLDRAFADMKRDGQLVMRKAADGTWKVMPSGEKWLRTAYGVTKGRSAPPEA